MRTSRMLAIIALLSLGTAAPAPRTLAEPAAEPAAASPWVDLPSARARLVASTARTAAGARLAGLELVLNDGWKTYWRMPGDAGVPPQLDWAGSVNVGNAKVLYPAPMRIAEAEGQVIGYKHAVLLPIEVTPKDATQPVALKVAVELGICRDICIAATATLDLTLPPAGPAAQQDVIAAALERVPRPHADRRPTDPKLVQVGLTSDGKEAGAGGARLVVQAAFGDGKGGDVFVEAPDSLYVPMLHREAPAADRTTRLWADLPPDLVHDLKGKTLTLTLVSDAGASEAHWTVP